MSDLAFDSYAATYDAHFTSSAIGVLQRRRVLSVLIPLLNKQKKILEINCGTGEDAVSISGLVKYILATDISPEMIREATAKKDRSGTNNIEFITSDLTELHLKLKQPFDILFSNFGGLNCIPPDELKLFANNIAPSISPGGKLVLVVMGKKCLWENLFFFIQRDKRINRRNTKLGVPTTIGNNSFNTYYYSPSELAVCFADQFKAIKTVPIGFFIPPSYLNAYFNNKKPALSLLSKLENLSGSFSLLSNYADHYLMILEKR